MPIIIILMRSGNADSTSLLRRSASIVNNTNANLVLLSKSGNCIGKDNKLSPDEDTFEEKQMLMF